MNEMYRKTQGHKFDTVSSFNDPETILRLSGNERVTKRFSKKTEKKLKSKMLKNKIKVYKILIRPTMTYALKNAIIYKNKELEELTTAERKITRSILGPNITDNRDKVEGATIIRYIKQNV